MVVDGVAYVANGGVWALSLSTLEAIGVLAAEREMFALLKPTRALWGMAKLHNSRRR